MNLLTPPDLLLITWNRSNYLSKTLDNLLADTADFRIHWWDNASEGETRELFESTRDERIIVKHRSETNVGQQEPFLWFLENATSEVIGKIDDDILLPRSWTDRLSPMIRAEPRFGMLGCWIFMKEDWVPELTPVNTIDTEMGLVLRMTFMAGHSFLMRRTIASQYKIKKHNGHGIPLDRTQMALDGLVSGIPLPAMFAHNMDDPRSEHCVVMSADGVFNALTARSLGFKTVKDYSDWIAKDARNRLSTPYSKQIRRMRLENRRGVIGRVQRKALRLIGAW